MKTQNVSAPARSIYERFAQTCTGDTEQCASSPNPDRLTADFADFADKGKTG